jgi:triacylglycerol lipase
MAHRFSSLPWLSLLLGALSYALPSSQTQGAIADYPTATLGASHHSDSKTVFVGRSLPEFDQELFLGIKYADQPVRFTPSSLKTSYAANDSNSGPLDASGAGLASSKGTVLYNATQYGHECPGYGSDETKLVDMGLITLHEDCLNLNIIRPTRKSDHDELLPVMIWIFGGGWQQGATADPRYGLVYRMIVLDRLTVRGRYNMSYILRQGALNGKPVLGVSINYRVAAFGFLDSEEVRVCIYPYKWSSLC